MSQEDITICQQAGDKLLTVEGYVYDSCPNVRLCFECKTLCQHDGNCRWVTCIVCKHGFCFVCGEGTESKCFKDHHCSPCVNKYKLN